MRLNIEINQDVEFELNKICKKRKETPNIVINRILQEWLEDEDNKKYLEGLPRNEKNSSRKSK